MNERKFLVALATGTAGLLAVHATLVHGGGLAAGKTESNYCSSRARLQRAAAVAEPEIALLGSSITGRLPDPSAGEPRVMNLGADGGSTWSAVRCLLEGPYPIPPHVVVEANTLFAGLADAQGADPAAAVRGVWFRLGCKVPALRADARPSSMLYARLVASLRGTGGAPAPHGFPAVAIEHPVPGLPDDWTGDRRQRIAEAADALRQFAGHGSKVLVVYYPQSPALPLDREGGSPQAGRALAAAASAGFLDLHAATADSLHFTDGVHLDEPSSRAILQLIRRCIER